MKTITCCQCLLIAIIGIEVLSHARLNESALIMGDCNVRLGEAQLHGFDQQLVTTSLNEAHNAKVTDTNDRAVWPHGGQWKVVKRSFGRLHFYER